MTERWQDVAEKGTALGIGLTVGAARLLGRGPTGALLRLIAAWYALVHADVRRASRAYLRRVGAPARLRDVLHHVATFARVTGDRVYLVRGETGRFRISREGEAHLVRLRNERRGALIVLSHLGSFEVLRALSRERSLPVNVLGDFRNARRINAALRRLDPQVDARLIAIRPDDPTFILEVEERIRAGELVGTMGDRVGRDGRAAPAAFLGAPARFPTGPYLLAAALGCPVYLGFGLFRAPDRYELSCEPFAERIALPRGPAREEALRALVARYAARLEARCREAPDNWFNFYDFWGAAARPGPEVP